jgi:hypothetical protein
MEFRPLFGITADGQQQVFHALGTILIAQVRMGHVLAGVGVDELLQQTIDRTPDGGDQMQGLGAIGVGLKRSLYRFHLSGNPSDPLDQVILVFVNV